MKTVISRRTIVRLVSFSLAIIAVLTAANIIYMNRLTVANRQIENGYMQAVEELAESADKLSQSLTKGLYASSPEMMSELSNELVLRANSAREALSKLPVANIDLERTEKFFSQIGNYAHALSEKAADGAEPSYEDYSKMDMLCRSAAELSDKLWEMKTRLLTNGKTISELFEDIDNGLDSFVLDGFEDIEDGFDNTPKLIYDGPFSDHILDKTPKMLENAPSVSREDAAKKAAAYCGLEEWELRNEESMEEGKMPSYRFYADGVSCAVTKNGGYISYMLKNRQVKSSEISPEDAQVYARAYLDSMGIEGMEVTYHETYNNVCTINYAYNDDGVTCYTDLIKVSVALDNGEILGFDARGFLVNHFDRDLPEPSIGSEECQEKLSPMLSVVKTSLAVIPSDSVEEKLCWEFKCTTEDDRTVLVYVNCQTGVEEDILILLETGQSTLTV